MEGKNYGAGTRNPGIGGFLEWASSFLVADILRLQCPGGGSVGHRIIQTAWKKRTISVPRTPDPKTLKDA